MNALPILIVDMPAHTVTIHWRDLLLVARHDGGTHRLRDAYNDREVAELVLEAWAREYPR